MAHSLSLSSPPPRPSPFYPALPSPPPQATSTKGAKISILRASGGGGKKSPRFSKARRSRAADDLEPPERSERSFNRAVDSSEYAADAGRGRSHTSRGCGRARGAYSRGNRAI